MEELEQQLPEAENVAPAAETAEDALNRGRIAQDEDRYEDAVAAYEAAIELAEATNDDHTIATALFNIGSIQFVHRFFDSAKDNFQESFVHYERAGEPEGQADCLMAQAEVQIAQRDFYGATHTLNTLLPLQTAPEHANRRGYTHKQLAALYHHQGNNAQAEVAYRNALVAFETAENHFETADCHFKISFIYKWQNDWARALEACEAALPSAHLAGDELQIHGIQDSIEEIKEKMNPPAPKESKGFFGRLFG